MRRTGVKAADKMADQSPFAVPAELQVSPLSFKHAPAWRFPFSSLLLFSVTHVFLLSHSLLSPFFFDTSSPFLCPLPFSPFCPGPRSKSSSIPHYRPMHLPSCSCIFLLVFLSPNYLVLIFSCSLSLSISPYFFLRSLILLPDPLSLCLFTSSLLFHFFPTVFLYVPLCLLLPIIVLLPLLRFLFPYSLSCFLGLFHIPYLLPSLTNCNANIDLYFSCCSRLDRFITPPPLIKRFLPFFVRVS